MTNSPVVRSFLAKIAVENLPPLIRGTLIEQKDFQEKYRFTADADLVLGASGISFQRSILLDSIRNILTDSSELNVVDTEDREWTLKNEAKDGDLPTLVIFSDNQHFDLSNFTVLSPDSTIRVRSLEADSSDVNLPADAQEYWRGVLSERPLGNSEIEGFHSDFQDTPTHMSRSIRREIGEGQSSISSIVPSSRKYYERLVGTYDGSKSIGDYAIGPGRQLFEQLSAWRPYEGFLFSLILSSHSSLTTEISVEHLDSEALTRVYDFVQKFGDRTSQMGAIEVGLRILPERPEVEPYIVRLVEQIRDDEVSTSVKGLRLFSALFILVDGELSRTRIMAAEPPFYRRLASLSQAALIHRQLLNSGVNEKFFDWAINNRGEQFYMQSLTDLRLEPRWNPDLAEANMIKADFVGRIMIAATNYKANIKDSRLSDLIFGADSSSIQSLCEFPFSYYPGPLEGFEDNPNTLDPNLSEAIDTQLGEDKVGPSSFIALVNLAMIFRVDTDQAKLAAKALKLGNYRLANIEDKTQLLSILNGLATVAAMARSPTLAEELRILVRKYRHDSQYGFSVEEALRICLVASASHEDLNDWQEFAGDWLTEMAFDELSNEEGKAFHSHLQCLCHAVPELWVSCSKADAALRAFNESRHQGQI